MVKDLSYFLNNDVMVDDVVKFRRDSIQQRRNRIFLSKYLNSFSFKSGDIIVCSYRKGSLVYVFEGICICLRRKNFMDPNVSLLLRNVIMGVGVELFISYYFNRIFSLKILDYRRKQYVYRRNKLFYLRQLVNQATRVS